MKKSWNIFFLGTILFSFYSCNNGKVKVVTEETIIYNDKVITKEKFEYRDIKDLSAKNINVCFKYIGKNLTGTIGKAQIDYIYSGERYLKQDIELLPGNIVCQDINLRMKDDEFMHMRNSDGHAEFDCSGHYKGKYTHNLITLEEFKSSVAIDSKFDVSEADAFARVSETDSKKYICTTKKIDDTYYISEPNLRVRLNEGPTYYTQDAISLQHLAFVQSSLTFTHNGTEKLLLGTPDIDHTFLENDVLNVLLVFDFKNPTSSESNLLLMIEDFISTSDCEDLPEGCGASLNELRKFDKAFDEPNDPIQNSFLGSSAVGV